MEKAELQADYRQTHTQIKAAQAHSRSIQEQLEFVRKKKRELEDVKDDLENNKDKALKVDTRIDFMEWRGRNYADFYKSYVNQLCYHKYPDFIKAVDGNLDALVDEEKRLENELHDNEGLLGKLRQGLNWLTSEIEKLTN